MKPNPPSPTSRPAVDPTRRALALARLVELLEAWPDGSTAAPPTADEGRAETQLSEGDHVE